MTKRTTVRPIGEITQAKLREMFVFDEMRSGLVWRAARGGGARKHLAGRLTESGGGKFYRFIMIDNKWHGAHRLIWCYFNGAMPKCVIDHINGDTEDNRLENLREASYRQNMMNAKRRADNTSGFKGVSRNKNKNGNCWAAYIRVNGKRVHLGHYGTADLAHAAYVSAARERFGEFARAA